MTSVETNEQREQRVVQSVWWTLRIAFGLVPLVAGIDKFFNVLTNWEMYLAPAFARLVPMSQQQFMYVAGLIEIAVGLAILVTPWTKTLAYVVAIWLTSISINLIAGRFFDIAVRDLVMAVSAVGLARLTDVVHARSTVAAPLRHASATT